VAENIFIYSRADDRIAFETGRETSKCASFDIDDGNIVPIVIKD